MERLSDRDGEDRSLIHQAIDELTSVMLMLQSLERHADSLPPDLARGRLRSANVALQQLGVLLVEIRNQPTNRHNLGG